MTEPDYYRILHVDPGAPEEIIRASYLTLMKELKNHPDLGGGHDRAILINTAYATLTDPKKRLEYDQRRKETQAATGGRSTKRETDHGGVGARSAPARHCPFCGTPNPISGPSQEFSCRKCGSPTRPVKRVLLDESGLRAISRFPKRQKITFSASSEPTKRHTGASLDISPQGMQFVSPQRLRLDQIIRIDCAVCCAVARVAYVGSSEQGYVTGVQFLSLQFANDRGTFVSARG